MINENGDNIQFQETNKNIKHHETVYPKYFHYKYNKFKNT